jgi:RND family efflux transporter MFP subunit
MNTTTEPTSPLDRPPTPLGKRLDGFSSKGNQPRRRRASAGWVLKLAALSCVAVPLLYFGRHWYLPSAPPSAEITATVTRTDLPILVTEHGELESSKTVDVRCEIEGFQNKIVTIQPEGTHVKKGDVVVTFDADQLQRNYDDQKVKWQQAVGKAKTCKGELIVQKNKAETDTAKARTAAALAKLDLEKYLPGDYKVSLEESKGDIELAKKDLQEAQDDLEHYRKFYKQGFGTLEQVRAKETLTRQKEFVLKSKQAKLELLENWTKKRTLTELEAKMRDAVGEAERTDQAGKAAVEKAQSDLEAAEVTERLEKSTLDRLQRQLDNCTVKAPQDGILVYSHDRWFDDASRIRAGAVVYFRQGLFSLPDLSQLQMKVKVHEAVVKKVKSGQKAEIRIDAYAGHVLEGTVEKVATMASSEGWFDRSVKQYETIVKIDKVPLEAGLKPGFSGEVKIKITTLPNVLVIPVQAVGQKDGIHRCYVVAGSSIEPREIHLGDTNDKFVVVESGLSEGEQVTLDARARIAAELKATGEKLPEAFKQDRTTAPGPDAGPKGS